MSMQSGRYTAASSPRMAEGWALERLTRPSRLFGANGLRSVFDHCDAPLGCKFQDRSHLCALTE